MYFVQLRIAPQNPKTPSFIFINVRPVLHQVQSARAELKSDAR